jgi:hypothetical protein
MINSFENLPEALAADEAGEAQQIAPSPAQGQSTATATSDSIAAGQAAFSAPAYLPYGVDGGRASSSGRFASLEPETHDEPAGFGAAFALIRAALPSALRRQFDAQLTSANVVPPGGDPAAEEGNTVFSESDLAKLVQGIDTGKDQGVLSVLVTRLAHDVASYGAEPIARRLRLIHDRTAFAAPNGNAGAFAKDRIHRRDDERNGRRSPRPSKPDDFDETPVADTDDPAPSIDDTVYFSGAVIATSRTTLPLVI